MEDGFAKILDSSQDGLIKPNEFTALEKNDIEAQTGLEVHQVRRATAVGGSRATGEHLRTAGSTNLTVAQLRRFTFVSLQPGWGNPTRHAHVVV